MKRSIDSIVALILLIFCISFLLGCDSDKGTNSDTPMAKSLGTVTDRDGNVYQTIAIGGQVWMAENLRVRHYRNGDSIPDITPDSNWNKLNNGACCSYGNNDANVDTYGLLYNWFAVGDSRKLAPEGWHVATDDDWKELEKHLGMSDDDADYYGWRGSIEGGNLKEGGTVHWDSPNSGASEANVFNALPAGFRTGDGKFHNIGKVTYFWSSTFFNRYYAWYRGLSYDEATIYRHSHFNLQDGFSVRCVRD